MINSNGTTTTNAQPTQATKAQLPTLPASTSSMPATSGASNNNVYINKTVQSIIQKYTVECKSKFDELAKIILKLNLCRKELREYDKQFKSPHVATAVPSASVTRKNSTAYGLDANTTRHLQSQLSTLLTTSSASLSQLVRNTCFGCASASIDSCITLFRALLCANNLTSGSGSGTGASLLLLNYVKTELCRQGILEELIYFSLRRKNNLLTTTPATHTANSANPTAPVTSTSNTGGAPPPGANTQTWVHRIALFY